MKDYHKMPLNPNAKFSSQLKSLKIFIPKSNNESSSEYPDFDHFVGRKNIMDRLYNWLSNDKEKGSYLITGYRGMGKSSLVNHVMERLVEKENKTIELWGYFSLLSLLISVFFFFMEFNNNNNNEVYIGIAFLTVSIIIFSCIFYKNKKSKDHEINSKINSFPNKNIFKRILLRKALIKSNKSKRDFRNIKISINLGHEVLNERDILCLITNNIRNEYKKFVRNVQFHIIHTHIYTIIVGIVSVFCVLGLKAIIRNIIINPSPKFTINIDSYISESWIITVLKSGLELINQLYGSYRQLCLFLTFAVCVAIVWKLSKWVISKLPKFQTSINALNRLDFLCDRMSSSIDVESGINPSMGSNVTVSLFNRKKKKNYPIADVREIESELTSIINDISSEDCVSSYSARFFIIFDELDKLDPEAIDDSINIKIPEYTDSVNGFTSGMNLRDRRKNVLKLLANMKLFVSSAKAKFIFISGRELYDAFLADLSDRDFAISSVFNGVINVDSFLSPEDGQTDVRLMSEWYVANRLLPQKFLIEKEKENAKKNKILKREMPSLKWYYEYLIKCSEEKIKKEPGKKQDIIAEVEHVTLFLRNFSSYLSHISNGSPKKISLYFDKYLRHNIDTLPLNDWDDVIEVGKDTNDENQEVLFFDLLQQKKINFIFYIANPIMKIITNDLSLFGDRYLVSLSFVIDHIYKHHNRSLSWRNLEQIPELLKTSKAPELRELMSSIMELLMQTHISPILTGFNEYKFHKSISEEISYASKISDEVSAIFNFTLDESMAVIQHNTMMLNYYTKQAEAQKHNGKNYNAVLARIHYNIGDLHFGDEDYYNASLEYRTALNLLNNDIGKNEDKSIPLTIIRCTLKLGLVYEYRKLYTSAYTIYCDLIKQLVEWRFIDEKNLGLDVLETRVDDWREKKHLLVNENVRAEDDSSKIKNYNKNLAQNRESDNERYHKYRNEIYHRILENNTSFNNYPDGFKYQDDIQSIEYSIESDAAISEFSKDLTPQKSKFIFNLTLFEEIRYLYQAILAKLSVVEKMTMSGITQTNIDVAENEFKVLHRTVNIEEKFMISGDFFRKLAKILYYKNSLTTLTHNPSSLFAALYFGDNDLLANLDDFCFYNYRINKSKSNAFEIKRDVRFFFENLNGTKKDDKYPVFLHNEIKTLYDLFETLSSDLNDYFLTLELNKIFPENLDIDKARKNVAAYLEYNKTIYLNKKIELNIDNIESCDRHRNELKKRGLRPACYACKYYNRSLIILMENILIDGNYNTKYASKSIELLKFSFRKHLRYTRNNHIISLAKTIEGMGNMMFSCSSTDKYEGNKLSRGISPEVVRNLLGLTLSKSNDEEEEKFIGNLEKIDKLTRLDKSIIYYYAAYRYYIIVSQYDNAITCLNAIITVFNYYITVANYHINNKENAWRDESETIEIIIGKEGEKDKHSLVEAIFRKIARFAEFQYDASNLSEIHEFKWILSRDYFENIDLSKMSMYPNVRSAFLRILQINLYGKSYLENKQLRNKNICRKFINDTYRLIAPCLRNEVTFYEEVLGYYVKVLYNYHILNDIFGRNMLLKEGGENQYDKSYSINIYKALSEYLSNNTAIDSQRLDKLIFEVKDTAESKLQLLEYIIHDSIICLTNMIKVFTPHNHLTSYSKSFTGIVYNYLWEWSRYYEILYDLYDYKTNIMNSESKIAEEILEHIASKGEDNPARDKLRQYLNLCCNCIPDSFAKDERYGDLCARLYSRLRHDIDDSTINIIFSNYSAEMAIRYYYMAQEANTEGDSYKNLMMTMYFLNDDFNNDTCEFNLACERFLLNCDITETQKDKLHKLYQDSNVYDMRKSYIEAPKKIRETEELYYKHRFDRDLQINSEY